LRRKKVSYWVLSQDKEIILLMNSITMQKSHNHKVIIASWHNSSSQKEVQTLFRKRKAKNKKAQKTGCQLPSRQPEENS